ncbi:MAG: PorP/SprF family type IX secretion system membrane protein [Saprospiraceae bacterium]|nr:PorP/SprF family type IX secretion system membrane protein [Saprospiraceae bacterium]MBP7699200.1 PorP/SprF family type IX secretion system membrane protein [Saprospiraceae bacterium]
MNINFTRNLALLVAILFANYLVAQDPIFSQYYSAPMQINPAFAGNTYAPHIAINYRNQWPSLDKAYITFGAAYDQLIENLNSGIGIMLLSDNAGNGIYKTSNFSAVYAYRLEVNDDFFLKFGLRGGAIQSTLNWDKLIFYDQLDPINGTTDPNGAPIPTEEQRPNELTRTYFDVGTGFLAYTKNFYGGISLNHLNRPDEGFFNTNENLESGLPLRLAIQAGGQIQLREANRKNDSPAYVSPNITYIRQNNFNQIHANIIASAGLVFGGVGFRHTFGNSDAAIFIAGMQKGVFKLGYSYDLTVSGLAGKTGGAHEVSLILNFEKERKADYNDCFHLFR